MSEFLRGSLAIILLVVACLMFFFTGENGEHAPANAKPDPARSQARHTVDQPGGTDHTRIVAAQLPDTEIRNTTNSRIANLREAKDQTTAKTIAKNTAVAKTARTAVTTVAPSVPSTNVDHATKAKTATTEATTKATTEAKGATTTLANKGGKWWWAKLLAFLLLLWWLLQWLAKRFTGTNAGRSGVEMNEYETGRIDAELGRTFLQPPTRTDDLSKLDGIDTAMAKRLNAAGIYQFEQLHSMSNDQQHALMRKFNLPGFDFKQLKKAGLSRDGKIAGAAGLAGSAGVSSLLDAPQVDLGKTFPSAPSRIDDLTQIDGIDVNAAKRLNAAGIYQFDQLKNLNAAQRANLKKQFNLPSLDFSKSGRIKESPSDDSRAGESGNASSARISEASPSLVSSSLAASSTSTGEFDFGKTFSSPPSHVDDLTQLPGIDATAAKKLNAAGVYQFDQLKNLTTSQREGLEKKLGLPRLDLSRLDSLRSKLKSGLPGVTDPPSSSTAEPKQSGGAGDSKTGIRKSLGLGAGAAAIAGAAAAGAKAVSSASASTASSAASAAAASAESAVAGAHSLFNKSDREKENADAKGKGKESLAAKDGKIDNQSGSSSTSSQPASGKIRGMKSDGEIGNIYLIPPQKRDDLTQLDGIDKDAAARMNQAGIYTFDQLNAMTPVQQNALKKRFKLPSIDFGKWKLAIPALLATGAVGVVGVAGVAKSVKAPARKPEQGPLQITPKGVADSPRDVPLGESEGDEATGDDGDWDASTRIDLDFGEVYIYPPKDKNDLTQLAGVDDETATKMNAAGIYKFEQLKSLSPRQQASFKRRFGIAFGDWGTFIDSFVGGPKSARSGADTRRPIGFGRRSNTVADPESRSASNALSGANAFSSAGAIGAAATGAAAVAAGMPRKKDTARIDTELGFLYTSKPANQDDLTRLESIDASGAAKLNAAGIYRFEQLKSLNDQQLSALGNRLDLGNVDFADWRRCIYAWGRGIETTADRDATLPNGELHGITLPQVAQGVFDGEQLVAYPEQVIFRGADPAGWGQNLDDGKTKSISSNAVRSDINYLRIRRTDTRESVVIPMTKSGLFSNSDAKSGWNGSSEMFHGGRHIGVFAEELPQEVETKFGQGGWGFGHRYDYNDRQEWGWGGRVIQPTTFEVSVGRIGEVPGTVVFRSADPSIWNTRTRDGEFRMADPISTVRHPIGFVRIMREVTGEGVIVPVTKETLFEDGNDNRVGWNGSNSHFSGGHHLGAYHADLPQEVETRFRDGGWGFGHPFNDNDSQAWSWAGRRLPETVFEISVLESVPDFLRHELLE